MTSSTLLLIVALPLVGALVILLAGRRLPRRSVAGLATGAVALALVASVAALAQLLALQPEEGALTYPLFTWSVAGTAPIALGLLGDQLSLWFLLVITGVGALIHVYSVGYMADESGADWTRYFGELNLFIFAMALLVLSDNFVGLLIGWAAVGLASFLLIGFWRERPEAAEAARKAFVINTIGDVGILFACLLLFGLFGDLSYAGVFEQVAGGGAAGALGLGASEQILGAAALLLLVGAVAKSAQLPLHTWLPDAMQGPTPVSALIHAATMVTAGVYLVVRAYPLYEAVPGVMQTVAVVGGASALFGAVMATAQFDIKRILAYSTMSQVGYMVLAAGTGAYEASLFHFLTHAFYKATLFLAAGLVIHRLAGEQDIRKMGGLKGEAPVAYWSLLAGALALAGAPLFSGFFSKDEILAGVLAAGHPWLWSIGVVTAGFTSFYAFRLFFVVFSGERRAARAKGAARAGQGAGGRGGGDGDDGRNGRDAIEGGAPRSMRVPAAALAVLSVIGGWIAVPGVVSLPHHLFEPLLRAHGPLAGAAAGAAGAGPVSAAAPTFNGLSMLVTLLFAALGAYFAARRYGRGWSPAARGGRTGGSRKYRSRRGSTPGPSRPSGWHNLLERGLYVDALYRALVRDPLWGLGAWCGDQFERRVIAGGFEGAGRAVLGAGTLLRRIQSGFVRQYVLTVFVGALLVLLYVVIVA